MTGRFGWWSGLGLCLVAALFSTAGVDAQELPSRRTDFSLRGRATVADDLLVIANDDGCSIFRKLPTGYFAEEATLPSCTGVLTGERIVDIETNRVDLYERVGGTWTLVDSEMPFDLPFTDELIFDGTTVLVKGDGYFHVIEATSSVLDVVETVIPASADFEFTSYGISAGFIVVAYNRLGRLRVRSWRKEPGAVVADASVSEDESSGFGRDLSVRANKALVGPYLYVAGGALVPISGTSDATFAPPPLGFRFMSPLAGFREDLERTVVSVYDWTGSTHVLRGEVSTGFGGYGDRTTVIAKMPFGIAAWSICVDGTSACFSDPSSAPAAGTSCAEPSDCGDRPLCHDGVCCAEACASLCQTCGADGMCEALPDGAVDGCARCVSGVCAEPAGTDCTFDEPCASRRCNEGRCMGVAEAGDACTSDDQCLYSSCREGFCCDSCNGQCERCDVPGSEGFCTPLTGGEDPREETDDCASCEAGMCVEAGRGDGCVDDGQCPGADRCVDGVCCERACAGECKACNVPGAKGECTRVTGPPLRDTDCLSCNAGVCDATIGNSCTDPAACGSGHCVDDVCCESACDGTCESCDADGACVPVSGPDGACASCDAGTCTDDSGGALGSACGDNAECGSGFCVDGVCCERACRGVCRACDVAGSEGLCTPVSGAPHGERDGCATCDAGVCADTGSLGALGTSCTEDTACESGECTDGFCCERACRGLCKACDVAGSEGMCTAVSGAPHGDREGCATCDSGVCIDDGSSGALGDACVSNDGCDSAHCVDGVCCERACRGTCKACGEPGSEGSCVPVSGAPRGDRDGCANCTAGVCVGAAPLGDVCGSNGECESGQCVDGVCCERACRGTCKACNVAGLEGQCEPISGDPVGDREGCTTCMTGVCIEASALDGTCVGTFAECEASINARITSGERERDVLAEHTRLEREVLLERGELPPSTLCTASPRGSGGGLAFLMVLLVWGRQMRRRR